MFLEVENLQAGYGTEEVLHGVSLRVDEGEIVSILGANGAGKTTTLLTISGLVRASGGAVRFQGEDLHTLPSHEVVRRGMTQSPEGRRVFGVLSVLENLRLGAFTVGDKEKAEQTLDWIFDLFPRLHERKDQLAGTLSGGEQQMLAIGRALMGQPKLLLLDEPSLGLAPLLVKSIFETIRAINQSGVTILIVEQNARAWARCHGRHRRPSPRQPEHSGSLSRGVGRSLWGGGRAPFPKGALPPPQTPHPHPPKTFVMRLPCYKNFGERAGLPDVSGGIFLKRNAHE